MEEDGGDGGRGGGGKWRRWMKRRRRRKVAKSEVEVTNDAEDVVSNGVGEVSRVTNAISC